ncbi:MAG: hypothetical protein AAGJ54_02895 [Planctomycetota bacterium]
MNPLLLSGLLLASGLVAAVVARLWRRGSHQVCRRCGFHLDGLKSPSACPECGRGLEHRRAVAVGDRRRWPGPLGAGLASLALLVFGYALIDSPAMDKRKPVWMLAAEHRAFGSSREARLLDEIERRFAAVPTSNEERRALAELAFDASRELDADARWHGRALAAIRQGVIDRARATERVADVLRDFSRRSPEECELLEKVTSEYARLLSATDDPISPLLERVGADFRRARGEGGEAVEAWTRSAPRVVLSAWVEANASTLTTPTLGRIIGDFDGMLLKVKPRVGKGNKLSMRIEFDPLTLAFGNPMWLQCEVRRVRMNGTALERAGRNRFVSGRFGIGRNGSSAFVLHESIPDGTPLGENRVEVDVAVGASFASEAPDELEPIKIFTRSATFELAERVRDVSWAESDGPEDERRMLESIGVVGVSYFSGESPVQAMRWRFPIRIYGPPFDVAHSVWAEQGEHRWRIGQIVVRAGANVWTTLSGPRDRLVRRDGTLVNETVRPNVSQPVRIVLKPDSALARRQVETVRPWPHAIDLGRFVIAEVRDEAAWNRSGTSSDMFGPPPSLSESR